MAEVIGRLRADLSAERSRNDHLRETAAPLWPDVRCSYEDVLERLPVQALRRDQPLPRNTGQMSIERRLVMRTAVAIQIRPEAQSERHATEELRRAVDRATAAIDRKSPS